MYLQNQKLLDASKIRGLLHQKFVRQMKYLEDSMEDPIVEEVRKARQDHAKKFNHDLSEICKDLKKIEKKYEQRTVSLPPKLLKASNRPRSSAAEA